MLINGLLVFVISYLIGSLPTAIIAGRLQKKIDIRDYGSGNAGATNVLRVLGWKTALIVLVIDMLKGFIPVFWLAPLIHQSPDTLIYVQIISALGAICGHVWTIFAGFKGGKGVGTSAGVFMGLAPIPLLVALVTFITVVALTRYVSLGSILSALIFLVIMILQKYIMLYDIPDVLFYLTITIVLLIWVLHSANIKRLLNGNENKVSFSKSSQKDI